MSSHRAARARMALAIVTAILAAGSAPAEAAAPSSLIFEEVHYFFDQNPPTLTVGRDGNVYGTAGGNVFRIDPAGVYSTYYTSTAGPVARLVVGSDGLLYGFTMQSPSGNGTPWADRGVFFRLDYSSNYTQLLTLPKNIATDLMVGSDGAFYAGTAYDCWAESCWNDSGLIKITSTGQYTLLGGNQSHLVSPVPQVIGSDGALYGRRFSYSGNLEQVSTFQLDSAGNFTTFYQGGLDHLILGSDGFIYGTNQYGGSNGYGSLIRLDSTGGITLAHSFVYSEGMFPTGPLAVGSDGAIYGVAEYGGFGEENYSTGAGTVYRVDTAGTMTTLHSFTFADGGYPNQGLLLARDGALYGVTSAGIPNPAAFRIDASGTTTYPVIPSSLRPASPLVQGSDCALYGIAYYAASDFSAILFRVFEPGHLCQRIDFAPLPDRTWGDPPFTVTATASSGLPVSWSASGSCSVAGDRVTLTGVGLCTLQASQAGDADFEPASKVSQVFTVTVPGGCADGLDNDGDGASDYPADPGCRDALGVRENPQCQDGIDNDFRPGIDFDGGASVNGGVPIAARDPQCTTAWRNEETAACGLGAELALLLPLLSVGRRFVRRRS